VREVSLSLPGNIHCASFTLRFGLMDTTVSILGIPTTQVRIDPVPVRFSWNSVDRSPVLGFL